MTPYRILDIQYTADLVTGLLAIFEGHAPGRVDENPDHGVLTLGQLLDTNQLITQRLHGRCDKRGQSIFCPSHF